MADSSKRLTTWMCKDYQLRWRISLTWALCQRTFQLLLHDVELHLCPRQDGMRAEALLLLFPSQFHPQLKTLLLILPNQTTMSSSQKMKMTWAASASSSRTWVELMLRSFWTTTARSTVFHHGFYIASFLPSDTGSYLLREKEPGLSYALSVLVEEGKFKHHLLQRCTKSAGGYKDYFLLNGKRLKDCNSVKSIIELLVSLKKDGVNVLTQPCCGKWESTQKTDSNTCDLRKIQFLSKIIYRFSTTLSAV